MSAPLRQHLTAPILWNTQPDLPYPHFRASLLAMPCLLRPGKCCFPLLLILALLAMAWPAAAELFPLYPSIRNNVAFWEDVYSRYSTTQGILHDQNDLQKVYGVVDLVNWDAPGSAHLNKNPSNPPDSATNPSSKTLPAADLRGPPRKKGWRRCFPGEAAMPFSRPRTTSGCRWVRRIVSSRESFAPGPTCPLSAQF